MGSREGEQQFDTVIREAKTAKSNGASMRFQNDVPHAHSAIESIASPPHNSLDFFPADLLSIPHESPYIVIFEQVLDSFDIVRCPRLKDQPTGVERGVV